MRKPGGAINSLDMLCSVCLRQVQRGQFACLLLPGIGSAGQPSALTYFVQVVRLRVVRACVRCSVVSLLACYYQA